MPGVALAVAGGTPGAYGKLPAHGDFLALHIDSELSTGFDALIAGGLATFRARRGAAWLQVYLTSPLWHFALGPGLLASRTVCGVMIPSVDAVGRYFPFAILVELDRPAAALRLDCAAAPWFTAAGELALAALEERLTLADLSTALAELGLPNADTEQPPAWPLALSGTDTERLAHILATAASRPLGLFWSNGSPEIPACTVGIAEPPSAALVAALFDGDWASAGVAVVP